MRSCDGCASAGREPVGLTGRLGPVFSAAVHVTRGKPHPDIFLHAAAAMDANPGRAVVIEDSATGVLAGVAAGMRVIGLCAGGHVRDGHAEGLKAAGAHDIALSWDEVAGLIASGDRSSTLSASPTGWRL